MTVIIIIDDEYVYTANVGDSKAVLTKQRKSQATLDYETFQLSIDHKPADLKEKKRILKCNGDVKQSLNRNGNPVGIYRVWLKDRDMPGLAMSRSIGDKLAQSVGVIPDPDISIYRLNKEDFDYLIVSASDGLWDALTTN